MSAGALLDTAGLRVVEERFRDASPPLMERAGEAAALLAATLIGERGGPVLVVAGPGNNGGDAWVVADRMLRAFHRVTVFDVTGTPPKASEAVAARDQFVKRGGAVVREWPSAQAALVVDGVLGIGSTRAPDGPIAAAIERINASKARVFALDIPSGVDADTGHARGVAVRADDTLTFIAMKPGLFTGDGLERRGHLRLDTLGLTGIGTGRGALLDWESVRATLPARRANAHKGSFGTVGILGGATGMAGAAILAARAGLYSGAGKVYVGLFAAGAPAYDPAAPELMFRSPADALDADVIVAGPGAGRSDAASMAIAAAKPVILDADALNAIAHDAALQQRVRERKAPTILTPHPGEAARLLGTDTPSIQSDRIRSALRLAETFRAHVVLKGAGSVVASPSGDYRINTTGNPGLASGGTGDVLAGMIGALVAQGLEPGHALAFAVCLHGAAADSCVARGLGPVGLTASDVALEARALLNTKNEGALRR